MNITYSRATSSDIDQIYLLCKQLIDAYENVESIDYDKVLKWVQKKIETSINEYTAVYADGKKAGDDNISKRYNEKVPIGNGGRAAGSVRHNV